MAIHDASPGIGMSTAAVEAAATLPTTASTPAPQAGNEKPPAVLPPVTRGSSDEYLQRAALATARASLSYDFTILMEKEKISHATSVPIHSVELDDEAVIESTRAAALGRLRNKVTWGSFVVEAGDFAAISCWEPRDINSEDYTGIHEVAEAMRPTRPLFAGFQDDIGKLQEKLLEPVVRKMRPHDGKFWQMSLVARDPTREYLPGAVRAVIAPLMDEVCSAQTPGGAAPIWLVAGGQKARDMYEHFGFQEVGRIDVAELPLWGMMYTAGLDKD
ncbi:uncharacterized protein B0I36DRAFT_26618 [Microdochium trichocladiopsis]|uniref:N-acetyltransferase domain-containing protein n=1 Tax=Microdochium trichocladiopsis TaxID=1682393 RepID=A0A9P8XVW7_9PEZI|nr:uncharacterized protein B0I36DRAFT_26618 [Microdochium trichocladiopsis]KAH7020902.1 hypothetical protein B0I36DRAFT_26618 [Microdochium trichocladiopsis]